MIKETLKNYGFNIEQFKSQNFNKPLLVAMKKSTHGKILIFCDGYGLDQIALASYNINNKGVYLSQFVVNEEFQQKGIGRFMFELAMAHGDYCGVNCVYGVANPTDAIADVSNKKDVTFDKEKQIIKEIYLKLGCTLNGENFIRTWKQGEIIKESNKIIISLIDQLKENEHEMNN